MAGVDFSLYLVTDRHQTRGRLLQDVVRAAFRAGVRAVQVREKDLPDRPLLALTREMAALAKPYQAHVLVNERADVCLAAESGGVQVPAAGLPVGVVRRLVGASRLIGASAHSADDALRAEKEGADFLVLGPLFETPSKRAFGPPIGLGELERARRMCRIPIFGIGGIVPSRVREVLQAGARGIAVVAAVMAADDVERASCELLNALEN